MDDPLSVAVLSNMEPQSAILGWGTSEVGLVQSASQYSAYVNAADWAENLDVYSNVVVGPQQQRTHTPPPPTVENVHTATFIFTGPCCPCRAALTRADGDNIQWMLNG